jgi:hypothetical protein
MTAAAKTECSVDRLCSGCGCGIGWHERRLYVSEQHNPAGTAGKRWVFCSVSCLLGIIARVEDNSPDDNGG